MRRDGHVAEYACNLSASQSTLTSQIHSLGKYWRKKSCLGYRNHDAGTPGTILVKVLSRSELRVTGGIFVMRNRDGIGGTVRNTGRPKYDRSERVIRRH
jgi:hypothetical protein